MPTPPATPAPTSPLWAERLAEAIVFAMQRHGNQRRIGSQLPYIVHPLRVAERLRTQVSPSVVDETALLAAILHDTIEDTPTTEAELRERFGEHVARVVVELTDPKYPDFQAKIAAMPARWHGSSLRARVVKLGDKLDNLNDFPPVWTQTKRDRYLAESAELWRAIVLGPTPPRTAFDAADTPELRTRLEQSLADLAARVKAQILALGGRADAVTSA